MDALIYASATAIVAFMVGMWSYYFLVLRERWKDYTYPPKREYDGPRYCIKENLRDSSTVETATRPEKTDVPVIKTVQHISGIPRCPDCGAAISSYDWECGDCGKSFRL